MGRTAEADWISKYFSKQPTRSTPAPNTGGGNDFATTLERFSRSCFGPEQQAQPPGIDDATIEAFLAKRRADRDDWIEKELRKSLETPAPYVWAGGGSKADWSEGGTSRYIVVDGVKHHAIQDNLDKYELTVKDAVESPKGFDCSGYAMSALKHLGIMEAEEQRLTAEGLANRCEVVAEGSERPGDLVFYAVWSKKLKRKRVNHVMVILTKTGAGKNEDEPWVIGASGGGSHDFGKTASARVRQQRKRYRDDCLCVGRWKSTT